MSYTHEAILQRTLINCNQRHIHAIVTNLETTSKQLKKGSQSKKICIDLYSMLKYFIKSQIQNEVYPEEDYVLQNQKILKEMIDKVNCMIYGIATIFATDDITVIFPQEQHFRIQKHYEGHIRQLLNQLLNTQFKQQRKKREYNFFEREQNKIYELSRIIYHNIGVSIKNPFTYEEQLSFLSQIQQEQFQVSKIIMKIKVPWLNKNIFYQDPCAIQLAYFASQGYICFSWSSNCLNYIPVGTYIIGFKAQNFLPFTKQSTKVRNLREESQKSILIRKLEQQNQLLDQLKKKIVLSEHIFYRFENFMNEIQRERVLGTFFRTDQLFLTALLPFSNQLDLGEIILDQIRDGSYSMPDWMIHKVFTLYFLIQLHPIVIEVSPLKYQQRSSKLNYKNKYNILFQNDMKLMTLQQKKQIIRQKGQKYLFIHKKFEIYLNKYIPKGLQNVERLSECSSPNNNPQIKQIISKKNNILSTSESNAKKQIEQYRKTAVSRNLFNNHQSINYQRISNIENQIFQMIKRAYQETIVQSDSDIDEQY